MPSCRSLLCCATIALSFGAISSPMGTVHGANRARPVVIGISPMRFYALGAVRTSPVATRLECGKRKEYARRTLKQVVVNVLAQPTGIPVPTENRPPAGRALGMMWARNSVLDLRVASSSSGCSSIGARNLQMRDGLYFDVLSLVDIGYSASDSDKKGYAPS
ncbi:hypothetical protein CC78DRAFT_613359 [Lojkania enalia]|uniref:Secreted protein n=1 Tax=Lojkania enalia TaxID=147567 RepID=A0A9P4KHB5_9PLEO|nr:hypothetical protein CC78DRAFT_613359 [Didymosphaeria enalia]